jgi:hypothetical protein
VISMLSAARSEREQVGCLLWLDCGETLATSNYFPSCMQSALLSRLVFGFIASNRSCSLMIIIVRVAEIDPT